MPKIKEFFTLLKENGKINNPKFDEFIEKAPDGEIPQEAVQAIEDNFMTIERAASHPDVTSRVRGLALKPINRDLDKIIAVVSSIDKTAGERLEALTRDMGSATQNERGPDTYKRMEFLSSQLEELFNKVRTAPAGGDEELKKKLAKKEEYTQELVDKLAKAEKEFTTRETNLKSDFDNKLHDFKLDGELEKLAGTFTLAEAYEKNRRETNDIILTAIKKSNLLKLGSKDGQTVVNVLDERGEPRFNGNSPVTINQLMEEKYKPFLKQSNAEGTDKNSSHSNQKTITVEKKDNPSIRRGVSTTVK